MENTRKIIRKLTKEEYEEMIRRRKETGRGQYDTSTDNKTEQK